MAAKTPDRFNLGDYLRRLFFATPGRYRVIVFVLRPPVTYVFHGPPTAGQLDTLLMDGVTNLPDSLRSYSAVACRGEALIYEFYRPNAQAPAQFVRRQESPLSSIDHLAGAHIWTRAELTQ